jgi:molybdopterin molybdotransferase
MTEVAEAEALIQAHLPKAAVEVERLAACVGRVLAEDIPAERDQPPFDRVTMDGIALAHRDWAAGVRRFMTVGVQAAGAQPLAVTEAEQCVEVMTGTPLPAGTDTVIPVERVEKRGAAISVEPGATVKERQYVHPRGSDRRAGSVLLTAGTRLGAPEVAVLAGAGRASARVAALPRVLVISTGDELVGVDEPVAAHQIRSTNDWAIEAALARQRLAVVTRTHIRDEAAALEHVLRGLREIDAVILSGGVSMGQFDFVPAVLERLGARVVFHRIRQRPGKPMWFGVDADGRPIFALPGNPVSTLVCVTRYVIPALRAALGERPAEAELVALAAPAEASPELTHFVPVTLASSAAGLLLAQPRPTNTSGDFMALAGTSGFVELPAKQREHAEGTVARLYRW